MAVDQSAPEGLGERLDRDYLASMKARDSERVSALRMVKAAIQNGEKTKGAPLTEEEMTAVFTREAKLRRESIAEFERGGRPDLVANETTALQMLTEYLPTQLSDEKLRDIVRRVVSQFSSDASANPNAVLGQIMRVVMPEVRGQAEGDRVRAIAGEVLAGRETA